MKKFSIALFLLSFCLVSANAQTDQPITKNSIWDKFRIKGSGIVNYHNYQWETDTTRRNVTDSEVFKLYLMHDFLGNISFKAEVEFEHGGTGITKEFDKFEEAGEYETEVEAGGEVKLEQLNIYFKIKPWFNIKAGRLKLYMGLASKLDMPTDYFTTHLSEMEDELLPLGWYENGIEISGELGSKKNWKYKLAIINGLDGTAFGSRNWIKKGHQVTFESAHADAFALATRFDYYFNEKNFVGISGYVGNSTPNRPKTDLEADAYVSIVDVHFRYDIGYWKFRGMALFGHLQNADRVSKANRNLSNNLNVKRTPVGSSVFGTFMESSYDISALIIKLKNPLLVFARLDYYDSMFKVAEGIFNNPRWERRTITGGINYFPHPNIIIKSHYAVRKLGLETFNLEKTFSLGIGFKF